MLRCGRLSRARKWGRTLWRLIVKLDGAGNLLATVHAYLPEGEKHRGIVTIKNG